jgi:hypothetical protein
MQGDSTEGAGHRQHLAHRLLRCGDERIDEGAALLVRPEEVGRGGLVAGQPLGALAGIDLDGLGLRLRSLLVAPDEPDER